jgi:hypothetical protein
MCRPTTTERGRALQRTRRPAPLILGRSAQTSPDRSSGPTPRRPSADRPTTGRSCHRSQAVLGPCHGGADDRCPLTVPMPPVTPPATTAATSPVAVAVLRVRVPKPVPPAWRVGTALALRRELRLTTDGAGSGASGSPQKVQSVTVQWEEASCGGEGCFLVECRHRRRPAPRTRGQCRRRSPAPCCAHPAWRSASTRRSGV